MYMMCMSYAIAEGSIGVDRTEGTEATPTMKMEDFTPSDIEVQKMKIRSKSKFCIRTNMLQVWYKRHCVSARRLEFNVAKLEMDLKHERNKIDHFMSYCGPYLIKQKMFSKFKRPACFLCENVMSNMLTFGRLLLKQYECALIVLILPCSCFRQHEGRSPQESEQSLEPQEPLDAVIEPHASFAVGEEKKLKKWSFSDTGATSMVICHMFPGFHVIAGQTVRVCDVCMSFEFWCGHFCFLCRPECNLPMMGMTMTSMHWNKKCWWWAWLWQACIWIKSAGFLLDNAFASEGRNMLFQWRLWMWLFVCNNIDSVPEA